MKSSPSSQPSVPEHHGLMSAHEAGKILDEEHQARRARDAFRASLRKLKFTRQGKVFVALSLGVGLAALNTGNNLLFLILGLMLATIIISGILAESSLRHIVVTRVPTSDPVAREKCLITYRIDNRKASGASFCLAVSDVASPLEHACATVLYVPPKSTMDASATTIAPHRGRFELTAIRLATRFPFGFFEKSRQIEEKGELFVLPGLRTLDVDVWDLLGHEGLTPAGKSGSGGELWQLRDALPGDDLRQIHFLKSASVGRFLVAEREAECAPKVVVQVNNCGGLVNFLEEDVENAAALLRDLEAKGFEVGLATRGNFTPPERGEEHLHGLLRRLACLENVPNAPEPDGHGHTTFPIEGLRRPATREIDAHGVHHPTL